MERTACPVCGSDPGLEEPPYRAAEGPVCSSCGSSLAAPTATAIRPERTASARGPVDATLSYVRVQADGTVDLGLAGAPDGRLDSFRPGMELQGRYRLESELGRGGFGIVFRGLDLRLERFVAVKVMLPGRGADTPERRAALEAMFADEARLGANLVSPAIATVFDYGFHGPLPYTVFEYVPGETLRDLLRRRGRMPLDEVTLVLGPVAQALDLAHARRVVHRDLKPENIRVTPEGQFKVLDLGLARQFDRHDDWRFAGTPAYASPEQASERPVDGRSDQYALAVIVFEMLTGRRPFVGRDAWALLDAHRLDDPPDPRDLAPELPGHAAEALLRALGKDPNRRFANCQEFAAAAGCRFLVDEPGVPAILFEAAAKQPVEALSTGEALAGLEGAIGRPAAAFLVLGLVLPLLLVFAWASPMFTGLFVTIGEGGSIRPSPIALAGLAIALVAVVRRALRGKSTRPSGRGGTTASVVTTGLLGVALTVGVMFYLPYLGFLLLARDAPDAGLPGGRVGQVLAVISRGGGPGLLMVALVLLGLVGVVRLVRRRALRRRTPVHLVLTADALWSNENGAIRRWPLAAVTQVKRRGGETLVVGFRDHEGVASEQEFEFLRPADRADLAIRLKDQADAARDGPPAPPGSVGQPRRPVVLLAGTQPGLRYQVLGPVAVEHNLRTFCDRGAQLRAALVDGDAVIDVRAQARYRLDKTLLRLTGVAVRAVDEAARFDLRAHGLSTRTAAVGTRLLAVTVGAAVWTCFEAWRCGMTGRLGTGLLLAAVALWFAWPVVVGAVLRGPRRPTWLTPATVTAVGWGVAALAGRFVGAYALSVPEPGGRVGVEGWSRPLGSVAALADPAHLAALIFGRGPRRIPPEVSDTLLAPLGLVGALVVMVAFCSVAGLAWRERAEYLKVRAASPEPLDPRPSRGVVAATVVSALAALATLAVPGLLVAAIGRF